MIKAINVTNHKNNSLRLELADPYTTGIAIKSITGLGPNKADINTTAYASSDGSMYNSSNVNNRNIVFMFQLLGDPETSLVEDTRLRVYKYFPLKKKITVAIETDKRTYTATGYVESVEPDIFQKEETLQVSLICVNPWFIGDTESEDLVIGDNTITYEGDVETGMLLTMDINSNTEEKVTVTNETTGKSMEFDMAKIGSVIEATQSLPGDVSHSRQSFIYDNKLHLVVNGRDIYQYDNSSWTYVRSLDSIYTGDFLCLGSNLYIFVYGSKAAYILDLQSNSNKPRYLYLQNVYSENNSSCCIVNNKVYVFDSNTYEEVIVDNTLTTFIADSWSGSPINNFYGFYIWTDGENIYHSGNNNDQFVLDKINHTWVPKTWNGFSNLMGSNIWKTSGEIYYSRDTNHYVLDKSTSTWIPKIWNGDLIEFRGIHIWTDTEDNVYYSNESEQYILNKETSTWEPKTWASFTPQNGVNVWTDGTNTYYSYDAENHQYVLNKTTGEWDVKVWSGYSNPPGAYVWYFKDDVYCSNGSSEEYKLNKSTGAWEAKTWAGFSNMYGWSVWNDGDYVYYSSGYDQYRVSDIYAKSSNTPVQRNMTNVRATTMGNEAHIFSEVDYNETKHDGFSISSDFSTVTPVSYYETPIGWQYTYARPYSEYTDDSNYLYTPVSFNNSIYILGGPNSQMYRLNGTTWTLVGNLPRSGYGIVAATVFSNAIWYMTQAIGTCYNYVYSFDGNSWSQRATLNTPQLYGRSHNDESWHTSVFGNGDMRVVLAATSNALHAFITADEHNGNRGWNYAFEYNGSAWYPDGVFASAGDEANPFSNDSNKAYTNKQLGINVIGSYVYALYTDNDYGHHDFHITRSMESDSQYRYMDSSFTEIATIESPPFRITDSGESLLMKTATLGNNIYVIAYDGSNSSYNPTYPISAGIYKLDGTTFTKVVSLPSVYTFKGFLAHNGSLVALDVSYDTRIVNNRSHITYNGTTFTEATDAPFDLDASYDVTVYNSELNILKNPNYHHKYSDNIWPYVSTLPYNFDKTTVVPFGNELHMMGGVGNSKAHYKWNGLKWNKNVYSGVHAGDRLLISTIFGNKYALAVRNNVEYNILSVVAKNINWLYLEEDENIIDVDTTENVDVSMQYPVLYKGV